MKPDNFFAPAFGVIETNTKGVIKSNTNPRGAGRKRKDPTDVLYRRIDKDRIGRITSIVDAALGSDEVITALEWVLAQYKARNPQ